MQIQNRCSYRELLTQPQWEAVSHGEGPLLVLAGAGSGKTRVITYRICHLVEELGVVPGQILAVTFTNKAAAEMKNRVETLIGTKAESMWISTFHSACVRILRRDIKSLDFPSNFVIYDANDQLRIMKQCFTEANMDAKKLNPSAVLSAISRAKNDLVGLEDYTKRAWNVFERQAAEFYRMYEKTLRENAALDFDNLIFMTVRLFQKFPEVLEKYQEKWKFLMVDEYQDTNLAQSTLLDFIAAKNQNLCVVGDDDQSIYKWRGAEVRNILQFEKRYPQSKVIRLEQNYRSTQKILKAAESVIEKNFQRKGKKLWTANESGEPITLYKASDEHNEALYVCQTIMTLLKGDFNNLNNFCILYRVNAQSRVFEEELQKREIPYCIIGGTRFYERKEIKDCLAYLKSINNPHENLSLLRIINVPSRGIGESTVEKLKEIGRKEGVSLFDSIGKALQSEDFPPQAHKRLETFSSLIRELQEIVPKTNLKDILPRLLDEIHYKDFIEKEHKDDAQSRIENVQELISAVQDFEDESGDPTLSGFLDHVALLTDIDSYQDERGAVTLMTLHSAKGLEFPVVFITGMEQGMFPHSQSLVSREEIEEERRLCYVGMTRAKKRLYFTHAQERNIFGYSRTNTASQFLDDIPKDCLQIDHKHCFEGYSPLPSSSQSNHRHVQPPAGLDLAIKSRESLSSSCLHHRHAQDRQSAMAKEGKQGFRIGASVIHPIWGKGRILNTEGEGDMMKVTVDFRGQKKKLIARLAHLEVIS